MCEGAETWAQRAADLAAEVVRLEDVIARLDQEIAGLHSELVESRELENWFVDLHNNGNKVYVQRKDGVLHEFRVKLPYRGAPTDGTMDRNSKGT